MKITTNFTDEELVKVMKSLQRQTRDSALQNLSDKVKSNVKVIDAVLEVYYTSLQEELTKILSED